MKASRNGCVHFERGRPRVRSLQLLRFEARNLRRYREHSRRFAFGEGHTHEARDAPSPEAKGAKPVPQRPIERELCDLPGL